MDKNNELHAWQPWTECLSAFKYLSCLESPGEFQNWRIYWVGTLTLLKTIRDVLERVDRTQSQSHHKAIHDFLKEIATKRKNWPAPGSEDIELGVLMEPEVRHGEAEVYAGVQA
jgi:hypothetical protein